jgi:signal transduction histidine kinase/Tfp pilus assembly protein PilF
MNCRGALSIILAASVLLLNLHGLKAQSTADSLINIIETQKEAHEQASAMLELAKFHKESEQSVLADRYVKQASNKALRITNTAKRAKILYDIGLFYQRDNRFIEAVASLEEALVSAKKTNDSTLICNLSNTLGVNYRRIDNDSKAMQHHLRALDLAVALKDLRNQSTALNSIGIILTYQAKYNEALKHFEKALAIEENRNNYRGIAINHNTIAWTKSLQGKHQEAIEYYSEAIEINRKAGDELGIAICSSDLGKEYQILGEYDKALEHFRRAQRIFTRLNDTRNLAYTHFYLGELYFNLERYSMAVKFIDQALQAAKATENIRLQKDCMEKLAKVYFEVGYFSNAYANLSEAYKLKDKIYDEQSKAILEETEARYNLRKTREEMKLLEKNNRLIQETISRQRILLLLFAALIVVVIGFLYLIVLSRRKIKLSQLNLQRQNFSIEKQRDQIEKQKKELESNKKQLEEMNATKDKFFSIIAHDLRNPFNALLSLTGIMLEEYDDLSSQELKEMLGLINESADKGYSLLENLLVWSRTQLDGIRLNPNVFSLKKLCDEVIDETILSAKNKEIRIRNLVSEDHHALADRNMIAAVVRNLVSNSVKYTPDEGLIELYSSSDKDKCTLCVKDNGVGIPEEDIDKLFKIESNFTRKGTKNEKGSGLGLILAKEFTEKNSGSISVQSSKGQGSVFCITLPIL